jgi:SAM-dependent methyltransferase
LEGRESVKLIERFYPESIFGGFSDIDGTVVFYSRVHALMRSDMTVLDVGCGRGAGLVDDPIEFRRELRKLRGKCHAVIGIDTDHNAAQNSGIDEFRPIEYGKAWPIVEKSIDLIVADFVVEHVEDPRNYFGEITRVLKPSGIFCARTANRIGYVGLLAGLIPQQQHAKILRIMQKERNAADIFQTYYRANTVWKLRSLLKEAGLQGIVYGYDAEPSYLQFSPLIYGFGKYLHLLTPPFLRTSLFAFARTPP